MQKRTKVIQFDRRKACVGAGLGALAMLLCLIWKDWAAGVLFFASFFFLGAVKIRTDKKFLTYVLYIVFCIAAFYFTWRCSIISLRAAHEMLTTPRIFVLNLLWIWLVCHVLFLLTSRFRLSVILGSLLMVLLALANGIIFEFRGKELGVMDFLSIRTAINVAAQYRPTLDASVVQSVLRWGLAVFFGFTLPPVAPCKGIRKRLTSFVAFVGILALFLTSSSNLSIKTWEKEGTRMNGYFVNFFLSMRDSVVKKPENYGIKQVEEIANDYPELTGTAKELPNIIVIMDESYADFNILGEKLRTNRAVTPFIDSLTENVQKGYALTSVYGGNTANAEFEFLTGHTMGFLPENSVPYQQFVHGNMYALPHLMRSLGYKCVATHPYYASGWSRERLYPYFGFEKSIFIDGYPQQYLLRNYIGDLEMFEYVMRVLEEDEGADKPLFLFGITMQNHGGYDYAGEAFQENIRLTGYEEEFPLAEQYFSGVRETDKAVKYLISALKEVKRDTVLLFFGDHFPKVEDELFDVLHGGEYTTLDEKQLQYTVPFFLWANFDIEEKEIPCTSLNYLSRYLLDTANIPLSPYFQFLKEVEEHIPAMNGFGYFSKSQKRYIPVEEATGEEEKWLNQYEILQYNNLFDRRHRNNLFFGQYLP